MSDARPPWAYCATKPGRFGGPIAYLTPQAQRLEFLHLGNVVHF